MEPVIALLYLNPATGSLAHQIVVGLILVITTFWRRPWKMLAAALRKDQDKGKHRRTPEASSTKAS